MRRLYILLTILGLLLIAAAVPRSRRAILALPQQIGKTRTVAERLAQYGPAARSRLQPYFSAKGITYPPKSLVLVGIKDENRLEIYATKDGGSLGFIRSYPILAASGTLGPKLREGDGQVPEGIYEIESLNPNSELESTAEEVAG